MCGMCMLHTPHLHPWDALISAASLLFPSPFALHPLTCMQPIAKQADGGTVNCVTVETVAAAGDAVGRPTLSTNTAEIVSESGQLPLAEETAGGSGNVSLISSSSPENEAHSQPTADDVGVTISSTPSDPV